jgi:hypothetical protein
MNGTIKRALHGFRIGNISCLFRGVHMAFLPCRARKANMHTEEGETRYSVLINSIIF